MPGLIVLRSRLIITLTLIRCPSHMQFESAHTAMFIIFSLHAIFNNIFFKFHKRLFTSKNKQSYLFRFIFLFHHSFGIHVVHENFILDGV